MGRIGIKQATQKGYIECCIPGVADLSYPTSKLRRGRVQGGQDKPYYNNDKWCMQNHKMAKKRIVILGAIGNTDRQNRDNMRVLHGGGTIYTLKSHIDKDHPLVLKRYRKRVSSAIINGE